MKIESQAERDCRLRQLSGEFKEKLARIAKKEDAKYALGPAVEGDLEDKELDDFLAHINGAKKHTPGS